MPIYEYETIPENDGARPVRFEVRQRMSDEPLSVHPETGEKVRRVYSSFNVSGGSVPEAPCGDSCECAPSGGHRHGGGCGCGGCCGM